MHRHFAITVPSGATDSLLDELQRMSGVVAVAVHPGASVQPPGDVVSVQALNRAADAVLVAVERAVPHGSLSVTSSQVSSLSDRDHAAGVVGDTDESTWEDATTALRHHAQVTRNSVSLMFVGGVVAACALFSSSATQPTGLVAAAVIAPGFEPLAKLGLGLVLRRRGILFRALRSAAVGYFVLAAAGALTMLVMRAAGTDLPDRFVRNRQVLELADPTTVALVISACGALAGVIMVAAHRVTLLAGPLIALQLIPAAAMTGMALAFDEGHLAAEGLARLGVDAGMVIAAGLLVFGAKAVITHRRQPLP
ncbi:MAG: DUF389 domain-containing protein [Actinomycetota bacterium]|nr:DUF389 domain-containing protein [Actinomycetota bacterium]